MEDFASAVKRPRLAPSRLAILSRMTTTLGIFLVAMALASCQKSATEPVTLNYPHGWSTRPDELAKMMERSQQFTRETGIRVKNIPNAETTLVDLELSRKLLRAGSPGADLLTVDVIWAPVLEPDLIDLRPYLADEIPLLEPRLMPGYTDGSKVIALPYAVQVGALEYRPDLLRKYGYTHPPRTWDELERMAARIQAGERAAGKKDFWGYVWQGAAAEALTCNALEWEASEGGGRIIEDDRTISVNNPATIRAWQRAKRWIGWISPPSVIAFRENDSMNTFDAGETAFDRVWLGTTVSRNEGSRQIHWRTSLSAVRTGYTSMPRGSAGSAGTLGGSGLAVSAHSAHREEAIKLVRFLIRDQLHSAEEWEKLSANLPDKPEFYDPPSITDPPSHSEGSDEQGGHVVSRPSNVVGSLYERVTRAHIAAVYSVLTGQRGAPEAAAELEKQLVEITGFRTGPPKPID